MDVQLHFTIYKWLRLLDIPVAKTFIRDRVMQHPDYPSLACITDILDGLSIENASLVVDKERIHEIPVPFLAHSKAGGGDFLIVTDTKKLIKEQSDFIEQWDGIAVMAERPDGFNNSENSKWIAKEKRKKEKIWFTGFTFFALATIATAMNFSWLMLGLMMCTIAGLGIALLIVQHEMGISNEFTEQLCKTGKNTDCDAVLKSQKANLFNWMNWGDTGLIWFSTLYLFICISLLTDTDKSLKLVLIPMSLCSIVFTIFSLYYQLKVVKKWCVLCLLIISVLWMQAGILLPEMLTIDFTSAGAGSIGVFMLTGWFIALTWLLLLKPLLKNIKEYSNEKLKLLRFKNNPENFKSLLLQQRRADITPFENDIEIGNKNTRLHIMICCSLYCNPCTNAHRVLHEIVEKNIICLTIRFYLSEDKNDTRIKEVAYLLQLLNKKPTEYKRMALHDWYRIMDFNKYKEKYPLTEEINIENQLEYHAQWTKNTKIKFTPTVFINGYQMPKEYEVEDLRNLIPRMIESEVNNNAVNEIL